jgi:hypothetical protein
MATLTGNDGQVVIAGLNPAAGNAVVCTRNFSVDVTSDTIETSVMGDDTRTYVRGMSSWSGSADIYWDTSEAANLNICSSTVTVGATPIAIKLYVQQDATNDKVYYGDGIITGFSVSSSMDGLVEATISFQGSGDLAVSTVGSV